MPKQDIATAAATAIAAPAFVDDDASLGNENVSANDLVLPQLKLLQAMSPELDETKPTFIEEARPGQILNTLSHALYEEVNVVPVHYMTEFAVFKRRDIQVDGPSYLGSFSNQQEAAEAIHSHPNVNPDNYNIVETGRNIVFIMNEDGSEKLGEALLFMDSSKLRANKEWNARIMETQRPRFAGVWTLSTKRTSNAKGSWFIYDIKWAGWVQSQEVYQAARSLNENINSGETNVMNEEAEAA